MKKLIVLFAGLFLMTIASQNLLAQNPTADATASADATIITPIAITKTADMNFGNIIAPTAAGTVTLGYTDDVSSATVGFPSVPGTRTSARFNVTGANNTTFAIAFPANITLTSGTNTMVITLSSQEGTASLLDATGTKQIVFGGDLAVAAAQATGTYVNATDFIVTVNYN